MPLLRRKLDEYLDDVRTKETLVGAVQDQVLQNYEAFYAAFVKSSRDRGKVISRKGKGREDEVWDLDTFAEWTGGVFRVGREGLRDGGTDNEDGESRSRSRSLSRSGSV